MLESGRVLAADETMKPGEAGVGSFAAVWLQKWLDEGDGGWRRSEGILEGWLVKHFLKAEPTQEALLYAREWVVADGGGVHEWPNLPAWMKWNGVERIEDDWTKSLAATCKWGGSQVIR